jgi:hypothetical protein
MYSGAAYPRDLGLSAAGRPRHAGCDEGDRRGHGGHDDRNEELPMNAQQIRAVIGAKKNSTTSVTKKAKGVSSAFSTKTSIFVTPDPTPKEIDDQVTAVDKAETLAGTRARGSVSTRNVARTALWALLDKGRVYVQGLANGAATPEEAKAIIEASGYDVAQPGNRQKPLLKAAKGEVPNSVKLTANLKALTNDTQRKHFVNWQYTADGGKTFIDLPSTPKGKTTVLNLTPLATYGFRVSWTNSDGILQDWSPLVSFVIH